MEWVTEMNRPQEETTTEKSWLSGIFEELETTVSSVCRSQDELAAQLASCMQRLLELEKTEQSIVVGEGLEKLTDARHLVNKTKERLDNIVNRLERLLLFTNSQMASKKE
ncbi:hypothetical protein GpartN1_g5817.t1 [Galdieria partita]|uniref:Uncharacterized protein n=1 Tax=Galdieria partita TaxID=83374 RepID=A0A9C7Q1Z7_9RHOD|nr:hypothetical protein GpartN1_g5817.t1 [Galdieria partita]